MQFKNAPRGNFGPNDLSSMEIAALSESIKLLDDELLAEGITDPLEREQIIYLGMLLTRCWYMSGGDQQG